MVKKKIKKKYIEKIILKFAKQKIKEKTILREKRPTLRIKKPKSNPYVNRFFDEEWAND